MQQKLSVTDSEVQAGRQEISKATDTAQQTYTDVSAKMASSTKVICVSANKIQKSKKSKNPGVSLFIAAKAAIALQSNLMHA
jgi:hypothetical protein